MTRCPRRRGFATRKLTRHCQLRAWTPAQVRERILRRIADSMDASTDAILEANAADVAAMAGRIDQQLMQRLQLKPAKLQSLINSACAGQRPTLRLMCTQRCVCVRVYGICSNDGCASAQDFEQLRAVPGIRRRPRHRGPGGAHTARPVPDGGCRRPHAREGALLTVALHGKCSFGLPIAWSVQQLNCGLQQGMLGMGRCLLSSTQNLRCDGHDTGVKCVLHVMAGDDAHWCGADHL